MEVKDLIITPIYIILLSILAYWVRPYVTTKDTRKYFLLGLLVKFVGAIMLGVIYQFYYHGGDTFNYFTHGSRWIWEAFMEDPEMGIKLLASPGGKRSWDAYEYSQHIWYYKDQHSYFVVRIVAFFDLFTFHTYSATALFFAVFSFSGSWAFYQAVCKKYPYAIKWLSVAVLFIPSVFFWGSGILKDTVTLGALGWLTWAMIHVLDFRKKGLIYWGIALIAMWLIYSIKVYILLCYVPMIFVWMFWKYVLMIKNTLVKMAIAPILLVVFGLAGYFALQKVSENTAYSLDNVAEKAAVTAYDIRYGWGARSGGDGGYNLGNLDGSWGSMIRLMPVAINVSLFRPYIWEVKNPLMLLAATESLVLFILSIWLLVVKKGIIILYKDPFLVFCLLFALMFAFAVGVSTANFGTLMRYKVPMMGFYGVIISLCNPKRQ